jgi:hypothetical protein
MILFSEPSLLNDLGQGLIVLGLVGAVSLFFFPEGRRILERSLGVLFTLVVIGGVALTWRAQQLRNADRELTPAQQATLGKAIVQFPAVKFEVLTSHNRAIPNRVFDAVKAGRATPVRRGDASLPWAWCHPRQGTEGSYLSLTRSERLLSGGTRAVTSDRATRLDATQCSCRGRKA